MTVAFYPGRLMRSRTSAKSPLDRYRDAQFTTAIIKPTKVG
jgi:hypothetical protein